ncbi:head GIN domain-containing protein [Chloroflexota bacterium]
MKKVIAVVMVALILGLGLIASCAGVKVQGSGNLINETFNTSDFTMIKAENGFQVEVTESDSFSVVAIIDDNVLEHIDVKKSGDTLILSPKGNRSFRSATLSAKVTMPDIDKIELSGGAHVNLTGFSSSNDLSVKMSGGSHLNSLATPGDLTVGDVNFNLSGGSHVTLSGSATSLDIDGSGGSHFNLEGFSVGNANIKLSGGSHTTVDVNGTLDADISGGSEVIYIGQPTMGDIEVDWESNLSSK